MNSKRRKWRKLFVVCMLIVSCFFTAYESKAANEEIGDAFANEFSLKAKEPDGGYFSNIFVNDFADILSQDTISEMTSKADEFYEETGGISVVVTTLPSLSDGLVGWSEDFDPTTITIEELATVMYNQYGIGKNSMGVLVLLSMEEGDIRLETGINMEGYLPDSVCNRILEEYGMPYFFEWEFDEGMLSLQSALISEIKKRVPGDWIKENATETEAKNGVSKVDNIPVTNEESIETDVSKENKNSFWETLKMVITYLLKALVVILIVVCYKSYKNIKKYKLEEKQKSLRVMNLHKHEIDDLKAQTDAKIKSLQEQLTNLTSERNKLNQEKKVLEGNFTKLSNKYERARILHPELENEIADMIAKEFIKQADELDEKIKPYFDLPADKDNVEVFGKAIRLYESATTDVKQYVKSNVKSLYALYETSENLLRDFEVAERQRHDKEVAKRVFDEVVEVLSNHPTGTHENYMFLRDVYQKYSNLNQAQRAMLPNLAKISELKIELGRAKRDYDDFTAAQEAQRRVRGIIERIHYADEDDLEDLKEANRYYNRLTLSQQKYFDVDLYRKIMRLKNDAEEDYERRERERKRVADIYIPPRHYSESSLHRSSVPYHEVPKTRHDSSSSRRSSSMNRSSSTTHEKHSSSPTKISSAPKKAISTSKSSSTSLRTRDSGRAAGGGVTKSFKKKS